MKPLVAATLLISLLGCKEPKSDPKPRTETPVKKEAPDWKAAFSHDVEYDPARKAVVVKVKIKPGYHAYTVGETIGRPMKVTIDEKSPFALAGDVQYPKGIEKDLPIGKSVIVEGEALIVAPITQKEGEEGDQANGSFRYQVCTDEACDRPRTAPFAVTVQ